MSAFDVVAGGPVADDPVDNAAIVFAPAPDQISLGSPTATAKGGASAIVPLGIVAISSPPAKIQAGVSLHPLSAVISVAAPSAAIRISGTITGSEPDTISVSVPEAMAFGGGFVLAPKASIGISAPAARVVGGTAIFAPSAAITVHAPSAGISISAKAHALLITIDVSSPAATILGGKFIDASNTEVITVDGGQVAGDTVAEYPVADGSIESTTIKIPLRIIIGSSAAEIRAGASIFPPPSVISIFARNAEIAARRRKIRILAIAS